MWKATFTAALAVKKKPPLREYPTTNIEDLLRADVTFGVSASSSLEGNFRFATEGPFKDAWDFMKNNSRSFVHSPKDKSLSKRHVAISRMLEDDHWSYFDALIGMAGHPEYQTCLVSPIPTKCVSSTLKVH